MVKDQARRRASVLFTLAATLVAVVSISGCGSSSSSSSPSVVASATGASGGTCLNVGLSACLKVKKPIRLAVFSFGGGNSFGQAYISEAKTQAKKMGINTTVYDGNFDAQNQFNQMQSAITSGRFNAFIAQSIDGSLTCKLLTQTAPQHGIFVVAVDNQVCGKDLAVGPNEWVPGLGSYVMPTSNVNIICTNVNSLPQTFPGPQRVGVIYGVATDHLTKQTQYCINQFKQHHPDWNFEASVYTDYTAAKAFTEAQNMLQAHPDVTVVYSVFADITTGALRALRQAGKVGKVKLAETDGSGSSIPLIKSGLLASTVPLYPRSTIDRSFGVVADAFGGGQIARYIAPPLNVYTTKNIGSYHPEY